MYRLRPTDSSYYGMFTASADNLVAAMQIFDRFVGETASRVELAQLLRDHEHAGDSITHQIYRRLNARSNPPFSRADTYRLAGHLDDVMDCVEAAADLIVLTGIGTLPGEMSQQIDLLRRAAQTTAEAMPKLKSLRNLSDYWIEVNRLENEADKIYRRLLSRLYSGQYEALEVMKLKEVADQLEEAADAFEHVASVVESIAVRSS